MADMTPIQLLRDIALRCRTQAAGLPEQQEVRETWSGIGFRLGDHYFVAAMDEITEILNVPSVTRLPNVKPWVQGVSNVRGRLIPVIDLDLFFETPSQEAMRNRRILVIEQHDQIDGLIVDSVEGMQYFPVDDFSGEVPSLPERIKPFVRGHYVRDSQIWTVISMEDLYEHDVFQEVAV